MNECNEEEVKSMSRAKSTAALSSVRCCNCRKWVHLRGDCPELWRKCTTREFSKAVGKVALLNALDKVDTPKRLSKENETVTGLTWVKVQVGEMQLNPCLNSDQI